MRNITWWRAIMEAFDTLLFTKPGDVIRVVGPAPMVEGEFLEIVLDDAAAAQGDAGASPPTSCCCRW